MKQKLLALILGLSMTLSVLPTGARAAEIAPEAAEKPDPIVKAAEVGGTSQVRNSNPIETEVVVNSKTLTHERVTFEPVIEDWFFDEDDEPVADRTSEAWRKIIYIPDGENRDFQKLTLEISDRTLTDGEQKQLEDDAKYSRESKKLKNVLAAYDVKLLIDGKEVQGLNGDIRITVSGYDSPMALTPTSLGVCIRATATPMTSHTTQKARATPQGCVYGAFWKNSARILLRKLGIQPVFLRFGAAFGHYFSDEIALAELCGIAQDVDMDLLGS